MDFFSAQDHARRRTGRLVLLLVLAVATLVGLTSLLVALALVLLEGGQFVGRPMDRALDARLLGGVAAGVVLVVVLGGLARHRQLRDGGSAVAEALGGRPVEPDTRDAGQRRLLNVVEEMAIASGLPVPAVYLLDDAALNAFAAGHAPEDAAIGVTRGALEALDRDRLQGVVAHEFSHILHGDMRLNLRLVALLHGLLMIGQVGRLLLHASGPRSRGRSRRGGGHAALLALGAALMLLGYAGTLSGNLIKAAVSRQREFLADASAVQYTRNPEGIGGALKMLAAHRVGSRLRVANAAEFSHLYFANGVRSLTGLTATHPPLEARIRRVLPRWDGRLPTPPPAPTPYEPRRAGRPAEAQPAAVGGLAAAVVASVGEPSADDILRARRRLAGLDPRLVAAAHQPFAARALVYGLLMGLEPASREAQRRALDGRAMPGVLVELDALAEPLASLAAGHRLPLMELAAPALRRLSADQAARFSACLRRLMALETHPGALQWALYRLVERLVQGERHAHRDRRLADLAGPLSRLLSTLALAGQTRPEAARSAFTGVAKALGLALDFITEPAGVDDLDWAMGRLVRLRDRDRRALLVAMTCCVEHDGRVEPGEAELLAAVSAVLGCPLPDPAGR